MKSSLIYLLLFAASTSGPQQSAPPAAASLPVAVPEASAKAMEYYNSGNVLWIASQVLALAIPATVLFTGLSTGIRNLAQRIGRRWFFVVGIYFILYSLLSYALHFPLAYYSGFVRQHAYGFSNQTFLRWLYESLLDLGVSLVSGLLVVWFVYFLLRASPRRWWFYTGLVSLPVMFFVMLVEPIWIAPLYNHFGPMQDKKLEAEILALADRAGIEDGRVIEVDMSRDTNAVNAYVTGFWSSKRIVLWDTLLQKLDPAQVRVVMAHEMGHYVLHHVVQGLLAGFGGVLVALFLIHVIANVLLRRWPGRFGVEKLSDIASLPLLMLVLQIVVFFGMPVGLAFSRHLEHEADRFALELTHDNHAAATAFVCLQNKNLSNPRPGPLYMLWRASHPSLGERIEFANDYRPWERGEPERYSGLFRRLVNHPPSAAQSFDTCHNPPYNPGDWLSWAGAKERQNCRAMWRQFQTAMLERFFPSWLRGNMATAQRSGPRASRRLTLERLEDRVMLSAASQEFNGPMADWVNVATAYHADPTGQTDSTTAFQNAINSLSAAGNHVLYVPDGTYKISSTLYVRGLVTAPQPESTGALMIVGQDPANTTLRWTGASGGTLLDLDGIKYSSFRRLTLDGQNKTAILMNEHYSGSYGRNDSANEYSDLTFENTQIGFEGGAGASSQSSELTFTRAQFINCSSIGLFAAWNNAWNWWASECTFTNCWTGAGNTVFNADGSIRTAGAGHVNVRNSVFQNSGFSDLSFCAETAFVTFEDNYSSSSNRFLYVENAPSGTWSNVTTPVPITLLRNQVINTVQASSIYDDNDGPLTLIDNSFLSLSGNTGPVVSMPLGGALTGVGDKFSAASPLANLPGTVTQLLVDNVTSATITAQATSLPTAAPLTVRPIVNVSAFTGTAIQQAINTAIAKYNGQHPVVFLPAGTYAVTQTIDIPAGDDVQLVGDGPATNIYMASNAGGSFVLELEGPSKAVLRDLLVTGGDTNILLTNTDQVGARVFGYNVSDINNPEFGGIIDQGTANVRVEFQSLQAGAVAVAGPGTGAGAGQFDVFSGMVFGYSAVNDAHILAENSWYEGSGSGATTYTGVVDAVSPAQKAAQITWLGGAANISGDTTTYPVVSTSNFAGQATVIGTDTFPSTHFAMNGSTGNLFALANDLNNQTTPFSGSVVAAQNFYSTNTNGQPLTNVGSATAAAVRAALAQVRAAAASSSALPAIGTGISDVQMYGVSLSPMNEWGGSAGIRILPGAVPAASQALLTNGNFETGDLTGWTRYGQAGESGVTSAHSGSFAAELAGNVSAVTQYVAVQPNTTYTFTAYVQTSTSSDTAYIWAWNPTANQSLGQSTPASYSSYTPVSITFTTGSTETSVRLGFEKDVGGGLAFGDDMTLTSVVTYSGTTWSGGGSNQLWSNAANWGGAAPTSGSTVVFSGATGAATNNNLTANTALAGIDFNSSAAAFTLSGNAVSLAASINDASPTAQTINLPLVLTGTTTLNAVEGTLQIAGNITETGGHRALVVSGNGSVVLSGTNSFSGGTTVSSGTLVIAGLNALPNGSNLTVGSTTAFAGVQSAAKIATAATTVTPATMAPVSNDTALPHALALAMAAPAIRQQTNALLPYTKPVAGVLIGKPPRINYTWLAAAAALVSGGNNNQNKSLALQARDAILAQYLTDAVR